MRLISVIAMAGLVACAGASSDAPLRVKLGIPRAQANSDLKAARFCFTPDGPPQPTETFKRCDTPGSDWAEAWVVARYDKDTLVELRRYERFGDDARALERFNQLVAARAELSPEADEAGKASLRKDGALEPGTKIMKAFRADADTVVGVFLLTPSAPENASILEAIVRAVPAAAAAP